MKRIFLIAIVMTILTAFTSNAQNRWNVYAGGSLSHMCETPWISSDKAYGWGGGVFVGGGYEVRFNSHWSLTPRLSLHIPIMGLLFLPKKGIFMPIMLTG